MTEHAISLISLASIRDGSGHSIYGPSGSAMYLHCAASLVLNLLAEDNAGPDAAYGTVAHGVTETWGKTGKRPRHLRNTQQTVVNGGVPYEITIDDDMMEHVRTCIDSVEYLPGQHFWEIRVDFSCITPIPNQRGTADFVCIHKGKLIVVDWKFGKGHRVYAKWNTQLLLYAFGVLLRFWIDYDIKEVEVRIVQPRLDHDDSWTISADELYRWAFEFAKPRMAAAWRLDAPRTPGEKQCQFCKVKATCPAFLKLQADLTEGVFTSVDEPVTEEEMQAIKDDVEYGDVFRPVRASSLSTEHLAKLLKYRRAMEAWWKSVANELLLRAGHREHIPDMKMVEGRTHRKFRAIKTILPPLLAAGLKREDIIVEEAISPNQIETKLKKLGIKGRELEELLEPLVVKPPGKPTLVPLNDKREAIEDATEVAFSDLEAENCETEEL